MQHLNEELIMIRQMEILEDDELQSQIRSAILSVKDINYIQLDSIVFIGHGIKFEDGLFGALGYLNDRPIYIELVSNDIEFMAKIEGATALLDFGAICHLRPINESQFVQIVKIYDEWQKYTAKYSLYMNRESFKSHMSDRILKIKEIQDQIKSILHTSTEIIGYTTLNNRPIGKYELILSTNYNLTR